MIEFKSNEEKVVALLFSELLEDTKSREIIESGRISSAEDAIHFSKFYWKMVDMSVIFKKYEVLLPFEGSSEYWTEQLFYTFGGYLEQKGFESEWENEMDGE